MQYQRPKCSSQVKAHNAETSQLSAFVLCITVTPFNIEPLHNPFTCSCFIAENIRERRFRWGGRVDQPFTDCHFDLLRFVQRLPLPYIQHALPGELPPHVVSVDAEGDRRRHRGVCTRGVYCRRRDVGAWGR